MGALHGFGNAGPQCRESLACRGHNLAHRNAPQPRAQRAAVDGNLLLGRSIRHGERHHHGTPQFGQLLQKEQSLVKPRGIHNGQDGVRTRRARHSSQQDVHDDAFIRGFGTQGIDPRQVDQVEYCRPQGEFAGAFFDRDAGIVSHPLTHAGKRAEQRRLARVRIADQGDRDGG